jgi:hypothetical protein
VTGYAATYAFSGRPLPRPSRPFIRPISKVRSGSKLRSGELPSKEIDFFAALGNDPDQRGAALQTYLGSLESEIAPVSPKPAEKLRSMVAFAIIRAELGISTMSFSRWMADPSLNFPKPVIVRNRRYFWRDDVERFKAGLIAASAAGACAVSRLAPPRRPKKTGATTTPGGAPP